MANQWFKFYGAEYLSDPKIERLSVQERSCWLTLLCIASQNDGEVRYLSVDGLLNKSGIHLNVYDESEWENAQNVLKVFEKYQMIIIHDEDFIEIKNWKKRQETNMTVAERVAKSRKNKKLEYSVTNDVTIVTHDVTPDVTNVTTEENRIDKNRIEKKRKEKTNTSDESQVAEVIKLFESVDPKNKTYYGNKSQRAAAGFLLKEYGFDKIQKIVAVLPKTNGIEFYPNITTPWELKEKWSKLVMAMSKSNDKQQDNFLWM